MILPYQHELRPFASRSPIPGGLDDLHGRACPVCSYEANAVLDCVDEPDGSMTANCPRCNAKLRMNPEGFVFLDRRQTAEVGG